MEINSKTLPIQNKRVLSREEEQLEEIAKGMEENFSNMLVKEMRKSIDEAEEQSSAMDVYQSYLDQEYSRIMAEQEKLGVGEIIKNNLGKKLYQSQQR